MHFHTSELTSGNPPFTTIHQDRKNTIGIPLTTTPESPVGYIESFKKIVISDSGERNITYKPGDLV